MVKSILWIPRQSMLMNSSVVTPNQKNGETVSCLWFWRTRTSVSKSIRNLTSISGQYWMVMLIHYGLNHLTLSWMITRCLHLSQTIEFHCLHQWDFCSRSLTWKTQVQLQSQEVVCFSLTSLISDGVHSSTVGWTDLNLTWRTGKIRFQFIILQSTRSQRQFSSDASNHTLRLHRICMIKQRLHIWLLHQQWVSFSQSAQYWMDFW